MISCDPLAGLLQPAAILTQAAEAQAQAVVMYSRFSNWCSLANYTASYVNIFSMTNAQDTAQLLALTNNTGSQAAMISGLPPTNGNGNGSDSNPNGSGALGPGPSTAVAMIILYSITGVITALFLAIIVTGALRAHRHPERYGPRRGGGGPSQSRARGLAKAMLDTLPIVRFGERHESTKPVDLEMRNGVHGEVTVSPEHEISREHQQDLSDLRPATAGKAAETGITAAEVPQVPTVPETEGCSICTDDFEIGQDQRVLPCDHRFHPACIDPWLLNVSGTCPLCRIDLRPKGSGSDAADGDHDNGGGAGAPPLGPAEGHHNWRASMRRSAIFTLIGTSRPTSMTAEQRLVALRELRQLNLSRRGEGEQTSGTHDGDEETNIRQRLRNAFHIRTRRTGENGQAQEVVDGAADHETGTEQHSNPAGPAPPAS